MSAHLHRWLEEQIPRKRKRSQSIAVEDFTRCKRSRTASSDPGPPTRRSHEMAPNETVTPSSSTNFVLPGPPASALNAQSQTVPSSLGSSSRKRKASGQPAAFTVSDYAKLDFNYVKVVLEWDIPDHVQQFRTGTSGQDISVEEDLNKIQQKLKSWIVFNSTNTPNNEASLTTNLVNVLFPEDDALNSCLRRIDQAMFTTSGMPTNPQSEEFDICIKNPQPDILYGYGTADIAAVIRAKRVIGIQVLETSRGVLCGSFPVELKCQATGGNNFDAFAQAAGDLAACLNSFKILRQKLIELGTPCEGLSEIVLPAMIIDEFTAQEVVGWIGDDKEVRVAISAVHSMRTAQGINGLLKRLKGTFRWLETEQLQTVQAILQAFDGASGGAV